MLTRHQGERLRYTPSGPSPGLRPFVAPDPTAEMPTSADIYAAVAEFRNAEAERDAANEHLRVARASLIDVMERAGLGDVVAL